MTTTLHHTQAIDAALTRLAADRRRHTHHDAWTALVDKLLDARHAEESCPDAATSPAPKPKG